jgi:uncharacterized protein (DUF934 family)
MQIVKDKQLIDNSWKYVADDAELVDGDITISLLRWEKDHQQLLANEGKLGLRIAPNDSVDEMAANLKGIDLVELDFPDFADGRLFSHAWYLRSRFGYQGEIRATGHFMPDQVFYLSRVGVNAFAPEKVEYLPFVLTNLNDFTVEYQNSIN